MPVIYGKTYGAWMLSTPLEVELREYQGSPVEVAEHMTGAEVFVV